jgi:hypothetical protein
LILAQPKVGVDGLYFMQPAPSFGPPSWSHPWPKLSTYHVYGPSWHWVNSQERA